jgi:hypothetical protein
LAPSTRSTASPHHNSINKLPARCRKLPWTRVALSGVRNAGTAGEIANPPPKRSGTNPINIPARSTAPSRITSSETIVVTAAMTPVAVRA